MLPGLRVSRTTKRIQGGIACPSTPAEMPVRGTPNGHVAVTFRCVVEFVRIVRVSWFDYAAVSSWWAISSGMRSRRRMVFSMK